MKSVVYIVHDNQQKLVFDQAQRYGELRRIITGPTFSKLDLRSVEETIRHALREATGQDWLLLVGNPVLIAMAGRLFHEKTKVDKFLIWDRQRLNYVAVE